MYRLHRVHAAGRASNARKRILDVISLDYHETLFAAAGHQAEQARKTAMAENKGSYLLVVRRRYPNLRRRHLYCKVGGQTAIDLTTESAADARAVTPSAPVGEPSSASHRP
ncbi:MAG: hypothetical protein IPJ27_19945 [Candidatus Accumulibacter sp.]|uniref:Uncharacterized protein n=1 Tax=Candidatus Accumulibacter proximus TaxID=2954385 RepID=A0A935Q0M0_9PROT|nr:hypothetical protein [Candidatus Accumulibacter proximus]